MKNKLMVRSVLLLSFAAAVLVPTGAAWARDKKEPIEKYRARIFDVQRGKASLLDIVIYEWTTPEERQSLLSTFVEKGSEALYDALDDSSDKGYVRLPQTLGYDMKYAWQAEVDGKRRIVLATDRPMGFLEVAGGFRSRDYNVSIVILELDPETGKGTGTAMGGAELQLNRETKQIEIEFRGTQPSRLTNVTPRPVKKKKG